MSTRRHTLLERPHGVERTLPVQPPPSRNWPFLFSVTEHGLTVHVKPPRRRAALDLKPVVLTDLPDAPF